jgi:hypothetical protein
MVYHINSGMARQMSPFLLGKTIDAVYHSSIIVYGIEYFFGGGICQGTPGVYNNKLVNTLWIPY